MSALPSTLLLYWCEPYRCSMPLRQCATNRERWKQAKRARSTSAESLDGIGLDACDTCPGVEALSMERGGRQPRPASDLRRLDSTPEPRVAMRRSARRIGSSIGRNAERRLGKETPAVARSVGQQISQGEALGTRGDTREEGETVPRKLNTHCKQGHEMKGDNLYVNPKTGRRSCRECQRAWEQKHQQKKKGGSPRTAPKVKRKTMVPRATAPVAFASDGKITLHVDVSISAAELSSWSPDRIASLFAGIGKLVGAKDAA